MKINIPIPCPNCGGKMYSISYDAPLKILKPRSWHVCKSCKFSEDTTKFKNKLLTV